MRQSCQASLADTACGFCTLSAVLFAHDGLSSPSGGVVRHILKQLEECGLVEKAPEKGRRLTSNGQRDMDQIAGRISVNLQSFF